MMNENTMTNPIRLPMCSKIVLWVNASTGYGTAYGSGCAAKVPGGGGGAVLCSRRMWSSRASCSDRKPEQK